MFLRAIALGAALLTGGSVAGDVCTCKPNIEAISCTGGVASFAKATCTDRLIPGADHVTELVTLLCPPGEAAISGGFRAGTLEQIADHKITPMLWVAPLTPAGPHPIGYQFAWRQSHSQAAIIRTVIITCEVV